MEIAITGTGYVGLSNANLLAQHNENHKIAEIISPDDHAGNLPYMLIGERLTYGWFS